MKKFLILLCIILILIACDRFEHKFEPEFIPSQARISANPTLGYVPLEVTFIDSSIAGTNPITSWEWDFDNDGTIDSLEQNPIFTYNEVGDFFAKLTVSDGKLASLDSILISVLEVGAPIADFSFEPASGYAPLEVSFTDESQPGSYPITNWEWDFDDNGTIDSYEQNPTYTYTEVGDYSIKLTVSDGSLNSSLTKTISVYGQNVLVELATGLNCVNCPYVEAALHNLKQQYGNRLSYVDYHINDELDIGNFDIFSYYGMSVLPTSVTQGTMITVGGSPTSQQQLDAIISPILEETPLVQFHDFNTTLEDDTLNGSVLLSVDGSVPLADLYLKFVLMENENTNYFNGAHEYPKNVVIAKGQHSISAHNFDEPVEFTLPDLSDLPDDITLVIWVQTLADPYNSDTCKIYNVTEKAIE
ncbi:MAG: PKD domain-containing protein [Armatimonadetes bacterium]|nr:PKD domain-containing protein [Armatimonadota bacterium]